MLFDPTGSLPPDLYKTSPSNVMQHEILGKADFRAWVAERFDLFIVTQDCDEGAYITKEYRVQSFPTVMLISEDSKRVLYMRDKLVKVEAIKRDIELLM